ncbi:MULTISPECIES: histidine triad nucleotide-binding protein [Helicobacter]|uniref:HIT-family protein n=1 Tax=Helicobacter canis TaxID=29419 RepID=A0A377J4J8_9HELI|nr:MULTISPECIES: histidine triad nucleotide-binding protein [Helicobacter]MDL0079226.1 histidine triad nucleotide-binding protein [Helicobacter sp. CPD2-1]STO96756.1 HIT-family protein [Helicobacter canis]
MTIFSKIVRGELPCKKVYENDEFLAFYDIAPKAKVHILAIPKQELKDFNAITPELMARFSAFILEVVEVAGIKQSGYRLITNTGAHSGQEVPHLHFHILGGEPLGAIV